MSETLFWIDGPFKGRLATMAHPRGGEWLLTDLRALKLAGVDTIVSLLESHEVHDLALVDQQQLCEDLGIQYISFSIPDYGVPTHREKAEQLIKRVATKLKAGETVAIHCRMGIGRSSLVAAASLVSFGFGTDEAFDMISAARGFRVPDTKEQRRWIEQLCCSKSC